MSKYMDRMVVFLLLIGIVLIGCGPAQEQPSVQTEAPVEAEPSGAEARLQPQMELLEAKIAATQTAFNIDGQVKNISPREVSGVEVYCDFQNVNGESIRVERGYLDTDPLAAGATSTFKISTQYDVNIKRFNVTFGRTFGGPLVTKDSREQ